MEAIMMFILKSTFKNQLTKPTELLPALLFSERLNNLLTKRTLTEEVVSCGLPCSESQFKLICVTISG